MGEETSTELSSWGHVNVVVQLGKQRRKIYPHEKWKYEVCGGKMAKNSLECMAQMLPYSGFCISSHYAQQRSTRQGRPQPLICRPHATHTHLNERPADISTGVPVAFVVAFVQASPKGWQPSLSASTKYQHTQASRARVSFTTSAGRVMALRGRTRAFSTVCKGAGAGKLRNSHQPSAFIFLMRCCGGAGRAFVAVLKLARAIQSGIRNPKLLSLGCPDAMELLP